MKNLYITIILFFSLCISIYSQQGWFWQNPLPQGNSLFGVKFISSSVGWTVGHYGTVMKTTNGGSDWILQSSGTAHNKAEKFLENPILPNDTIDSKYMIEKLIARGNGNGLSGSARVK
ncbi:MAG: hypothetical protein EHM47_03145 [Ignavibacteriales bacterium]|nr:MAG: hypothetical protein EHM47_03145 [Ignavibacteriales bacterium]